MPNSSIRQIEFIQVLPVSVSVDLGVMAVKGHSAFHEAPGLLERHH